MFYLGGKFKGTVCKILFSLSPVCQLLTLWVGGQPFNLPKPKKVIFHNLDMRHNIFHIAPFRKRMLSNIKIKFSQDHYEGNVAAHLHLVISGGVALGFFNLQFSIPYLWSLSLCLVRICLCGLSLTVETDNASAHNLCSGPDNVIIFFDCFFIVLCYYNLD